MIDSYNLGSLHVKHFKSFLFVCFNYDYYSFELMKVKKYSISKYNISLNQSKKGFAKQKSSFKVCSFMHSIVNLCTLVGAPLAQTPASVRCGMDAISL